MRNHELIEKFYTAFANHDAQVMAQCYHPNVDFSDPVFGKLKGKSASDMWKMLLERSNGQLEIDFSNVMADENTGSAKWVAKYKFSMTNRSIVNYITAEFKFKDGLIVRHDDHFDLWKWTRQAFGLKGLLLGWTGVMQQKIRNQAQKSLAAYQNH